MHDWCTGILRMRLLEQSDNYDSAEEDAYEAIALPDANKLCSQVEPPGPTLRAVGGDHGTQRRGRKAAKAPPPVSAPRTQASREHGASCHTRAVNPWLLVRQVVPYSTTVPNLHLFTHLLIHLFLRHVAMRGIQDDFSTNAYGVNK